jgi:hypothetical protein
VNSNRLLAALIATLPLVACATPDPQPSTARQDKVYTTGSRIPVRTGGGSAEVNSVENKQSIDDTLRNRDVHIPGKGGPQ